MINMPIYTALTASIIMVFQMALMMMVGFARLKTNVGIGEGDNEKLLLSVRRHGNLTENAPLFLLLMGLGEMYVGTTNFILGLGIAFVIARVAHAIGLTIGSGPNPARAIGAFGTLVTGITIASYVSYTLVSTM